MGAMYEPLRELAQDERIIASREGGDSITSTARLFEQLAQNEAMDRTLDEKSATSLYVETVNLEHWRNLAT
jgi:hypothetical protein